MVRRAMVEVTPAPSFRASADCAVQLLGEDSDWNEQLWRWEGSGGRVVCLVPAVRGLLLDPGPPRRLMRVVGQASGGFLGGAGVAEGEGAPDCDDADDDCHEGVGDPFALEERCDEVAAPDAGG